MCLATAVWQESIALRLRPAKHYDSFYKDNFKQRWDKDDDDEDYYVRGTRFPLYSNRLNNKSVLKNEMQNSSNNKNIDNNIEQKARHKKIKENKSNLIENWYNRNNQNSLDKQKTKEMTISHLDGANSSTAHRYQHRSNLLSSSSTNIKKNMGGGTTVADITNQSLVIINTATPFIDYTKHFPTAGVIYENNNNKTLMEYSLTNHLNQQIKPIESETANNGQTTVNNNLQTSDSKQILEPETLKPEEESGEGRAEEEETDELNEKQSDYQTDRSSISKAKKKTQVSFSYVL